MKKKAKKNKNTKKKDNKTNKNNKIKNDNKKKENLKESNNTNNKEIEVKKEENITKPKKDKKDKEKKKNDKKILTEQKEKKKKSKVKLAFAGALIIVSFGGLGYASYQVYTSFRDYHKSDKMVDKINENVTITEVEEPVGEENNVQVVEPQPEVVYDENNPYWKYIKMNLIDVDFSELKNINSDTVGWIQVNGTNINYPFVKTTDNDFYLTHQFDKTSNKGGWLFMDYRNSNTLEDKNIIIYGHNMANSSMFGTLINTLSSSWLNNLDNHVVKLSTGSANTLWQVFSIYQIDNTNDYMQTVFNSDEEFKTFVDMLQARSAYNFNTTVSGTDKIITLSTCQGNSKKMVLHAKLIKYSER